ncbi:MAG: bifunctional phosphoribosyl-AMP cyclohydrolase/phosphoribosyl-ATP diphosphatase HisIE [archaeon]
MNLKPVIAQDASTKEVLMLAWANEEALEKTKETGYAWYWSRSRNKLWKKGESSGNVQKIVEVMEDCDKDALLYIVEQKGNACHTGKYSCFKKEKPFTLEVLEKVIEQRKLEKQEGSYTVKLLEDEELACEKVLEEAGEVVQAVKKEGKQRTIEEAADVLYHLMVLLAGKGIKWIEVVGELSNRSK